MVELDFAPRRLRTVEFRYAERLIPDKRLNAHLLDVARQFALDVYQRVPEVARVFLYGSVAAGYAKDTSDIDIYLFYTRPREQWEWRLNEVVEGWRQSGIGIKGVYRGQLIGLDAAPLSELPHYHVGEGAWLYRFLELPRHPGARLRPFPSVVISKRR